MNRECITRPYQKGEEEEIVRLLNIVFNGWPKIDLRESNLEYWKWKFLDGPLPSSSTVSISDNRIIGCLHAIPVRIKIGASYILGCSLVDFAVHKDFRGMGLSRKMTDFTHETLFKRGVKFNYAITGNPILISSLEKRLGRFPHPIVNLVSIKDIDTHLKAMPIDNDWLMKIGYQVVKTMSRLRGVVGSSTKQKHEFHITEISKFDERIDEFWAKTSPHYNFIVERSMDYLNWRYCDHRGGKFIVKQAEDSEGTIAGYIVLNVNRYLSDYPIGYVVDLLGVPKNSAVVGALIRDAILFFEENDVNIVNYQVVKGSPYEDLVQRLGFLDSRIKIHLFIYEYGQTNINNAVSKSSPGRILLSWGDHDVLPVTMPNTRAK